MAIGGEEVSAASVKLYTLSTCPVCDKAREVLTERGLAFEERLLDDREDWQDEVIGLTNQYTVPVLVYPDGQFEIGIDGELG